MQSEFITARLHEWATSKLSLKYTILYTSTTPQLRALT